MNVTLITQDEPFYLAENIDHLISNLPSHSRVVSCVVFDVSPFGRKESFLKKATKTYEIFGLMFFIRYGFKYILNKFDPDNNVRHVMKKHNIPLIELQQNINSDQSVEIIKSYSPDILISIAGNQIFRKPIIELAPKGCLNLHTAMLPRYRGLMPTFWALLNNEEYIGVSVFFVDEGIDSGPIVVQKKLPANNSSLEEMIRLTKRAGMEAIIEAIDLIERDSYELMPNDDALQTYFTFPTKQDVREFLKRGKRLY